MTPGGHALSVMLAAGRPASLHLGKAGRPADITPPASDVAGDPAAPPRGRLDRPNITRHGRAEDLRSYPRQNRLSSTSRSLLRPSNCSPGVGTIAAADDIAHGVLALARGLG
jgi:hypothetical protein